MSANIFSDTTQAAADALDDRARLLKNLHEQTQINQKLA
jgi:hypothetical protein